jgi:transposase
MRAGRPTPRVVLTVKERYTLKRWAHRRDSRILAQRARIVLACAAGRTNDSIAGRTGVSRQTVGRWRWRFLAMRLAGLRDEPRPGAPWKISEATLERVRRLMLEATRGARRWSTRAVAKRCRLSQTTVCRIWRAWQRQKIEKSVAFSVMNSSKAGVPSRVWSTARLMAGTISPGSVTRSPQPPRARAKSA